MEQLVVANGEIDHGVAKHDAANDVGAGRHGVQHQLHSKMSQHRLRTDRQSFALQYAFCLQTGMDKECSSRERRERRKERDEIAAEITAEFTI